MRTRVQRHRSWRARLLLMVVGVALGIGLWYGYTVFQSRTIAPDNLPTAEEWERIRAVEETGSTFDPNSTPGVGVVPTGSKPRVPIVEEVATTSTETATSTPQDDNETGEDEVATTEEMEV